MRYRKPFTVFPRTLKSGKKVYYYHAYDSDGRRTNYRSTGQTTRAAAETYCLKLYRENKLLTRVKEITFAEYTRTWWIFEKCGYIRGRKVRGFPITRRYADNQRMNLEKHILPVFGDKKLNRITVNMIDSWLRAFLGNGFSGSRANQCVNA